MSARIFIVEDDAQMRRVTKFLFERNKYKVSQAETAEDALAEISRDPPHLVIVDVHLPGMSGMKLVELLRGDKKTAHVLILMLTSAQQTADKVRGLRCGADDYVTKPYEPSELLARAEALLRRSMSTAPVEGVLELRGLKVHLGRREVTVDGKPISLRKKEYELLLFFLKHPGQLLTKERISLALWGDDVIVTDNALTAQIRNLRSQLGKYGPCLETFIGEGYRLSDSPR